MTTIQQGSLILTVLNESSSIRRFLDSLGAQTTLPAEVIIVDGGSTDGTVDEINAWIPPEGLSYRVIVRPGANISEGRNEALHAATHERVLVTDAGTTLNRDWVDLMLAAFDRPEQPDVVCGFFSAVGNTFLERSIAHTISPDITEIDERTFLPSSRSLGITRSAWKRAGGYPEWLDYCEDLVFDIRMKELGLVFAFVGEARVTWSARSSIFSFMKQYYRYARGDGKANLWQKRHAIRYAAYALGLGLAVGAVFQPWLLILLGAGFAGYMQKFWRRVLRNRDEFGTSIVAAVALVPAIVVIGDLAKMAGYPAGVVWRRSHARSGPESTWGAQYSEPELG